MKKLLFGVLGILVVAVTVYAASPVPPWVQAYINTPQDKPGLQLARTARATYDVAVHGGSVAAHALGVSLPKGAIIKRSFYYVQTAFTDPDGSTGTVALHCEDANNIKTATDMTAHSANTLVEGESTGATSAMKLSLAAGCEITATVATAAQSTGKLTVFVDYVVHN